MLKFTFAMDMAIQMTCQNNTEILKLCTSRSGQLSQVTLDVAGVRLPASEDRRALDLDSLSHFVQYLPG